MWDGTVRWCFQTFLIKYFNLMNSYLLQIFLINLFYCIFDWFVNLADNQLFSNSETLVNLITFKKRNSLRPKVYIVLTSDNIHNPYLWNTLPYWFLAFFTLPWKHKKMPLFPLKNGWVSSRRVHLLSHQTESILPIQSLLPTGHQMDMMLKYGYQRMLKNPFS